MNRRRFLKAALGVAGAALLPIPIPKPKPPDLMVDLVSWWRTPVDTGRTRSSFHDWASVDCAYEIDDKITIHRGEWPKGAQFDG